MPSPSGQATAAPALGLGAAREAMLQALALLALLDGKKPKPLRGVPS